MRIVVKSIKFKILLNDSIPAWTYLFDSGEDPVGWHTMGLPVSTRHAAAPIFPAIPIMK